MNSNSNRELDGMDQPARDVDDATRFSAAEDQGQADDHDFEISEEARPPSSIGVVGEYLLLEPIGAGGMGQVYRAEHRTMNREVALKVLSSSIAGQRRLREQFFAEIRAVAKLMHPNIVTAFDAGSVGETHYLVMELVRGEVLSSRIRQQGPLTSEEAVHVLVQAAQALRYAHSVGIVHRDIKPSNMMLTDDGTLKILDFGLARFGKAESTSDKNLFMGTPEFMSPEQIEDPDAVDQRSDLYSLGATLFYLMTGQPMFSGEHTQVAIAQIRQQPPALFIARGDVDLRLDAVFQRLVEKKPANRYASADALLSDLRKLGLVGAPVESPQKKLLAKGSNRLGDSPTSVALSRSTLSKRSQIVAIDLGMIASTAAYFDENLGPQLIDQGEGSAQHLRNMIWSSPGKIEIGAQAAKYRQRQPKEVVHCVQRGIASKEPLLNLCGERVPAVVALAAILRQIMVNAAGATESATSAIVTVPTCYDQVHRRAVRDACKIAGVDLVQLLDKPLAAALSWNDVNNRLGQQDSDKDKIILFVHLGGTGLEASVLRASDSTVEQLGGHGSLKHGSLRWQHLLCEYFIGVLDDATGKSIRDDVLALTRLKRSVELAMDRLSHASKVEVRFEWSGATIQQTITQQGLVKIAPDMKQQLELAVAGALQSASIEPGEVAHLLLAGSMMKMKPIREIVRSAVPQAKISQLEKADFSRGAAIQAHHYAALTKRQSGERAHAVPRSAFDLGLMVAAASKSSPQPHVLIDQASILPAHCTRTLRPHPGAQGTPGGFSALRIIEGTCLGNNNWHLLAKVQPDQVFPDREEGQPIQLRFEVDESGILAASLLWPEGNRQVLLQACCESAFSKSEIESWNHWLDTAMLCSTS